MKLIPVLILLVAAQIHVVEGQTAIPAQPRALATAALTNSQPRFIRSPAVTEPATVKPLQQPIVPASITNGWVATVIRRPSPSDIRKVRLIDGGARADFGLHKVGFAANVGTAQPIAITAPDGQALRFRPAFLVYYDTSNGKSVVLAEVGDCVGGVQMPDKVIYQNAFSDLQADVQYRCTMNSLEQNIILHQRPPAPEDLGLNPETTHLEMWTEWFNTTPRKQEHSIVTLRAKSDTLNATLADDAALDFGTMKIVRGKAFNLNEQANSMPVAKEWHQIEGRNFLLEVVDYKAIEQSLKTLPLGGASPAKQAYSSRERLVRSMAGGTNPTKRQEMQLAKVETKSEKGVVLDFTIIASIPLPQGAVSWWPAGGNADDAIGGNNGTLNDVYFGAGEVGQAFGFNTEGAAARIPANANLDVGQGDGFTIECWVNPTSASLWGSSPLVEWNDGNYWGVHFFINEYYGAPGNFYANIVDEWGGWHHINSGGGVVSNEFQHLALTYDKTSGIADLYRNGVLVAEEDMGSFTPLTSYDLYLGRRTAPDYDEYTYSGLLDEVTLYNRALSSSEIADIYNAGGAGKFNPNCVNPSTNIVGWWPGDGNTYDFAELNHGILTNGADFGAGEVSQAFRFSTSNATVKIPANTNLDVGQGDGFTIECWVNPTSASVWGSVPLVEWNDGNYWGVHFFINEYYGAPGNFFANIVDDGGGWHHINSGGGVVSNEFQHLALTYDKTSGIADLYHNGVLVAEDDMGSFTPLTSYDLYLGRRTAPDYDLSTYSGLIDEVTLYNRALTGTEISAIYSAGCAGKCKVDSDNDGLPDWWEWKYFGNLDQTGSDDYDSDGVSNLNEYLNGTDPTRPDPLSTPGYSIFIAEPKSMTTIP